MAGRPSQFIPLREQTLGLLSNYSEETSGGFFSRLQLAMDGTVTNGSSTQVPIEGLAEWLGDVRITQNSAPKFQCRAVDLRLISRLFGSPGSYVFPNTSGAQAVGQVIDIDFGAMIPGSGFDGSGKNRVGIRTDTGAGLSLGTVAATAAAIKLKPQLEHYGGSVPDAASILTPAWSQDFQPLNTAANNIPVRKQFQNRGQLFGVAIRTFDASLGSATAWRRADNMVTRVKQRLLPAGSNYEELFDFSWSQAKAATQKSFRVVEAQIEPGFVLHRFIDPRNRAGNYALEIAENDGLEVNLDNLSAIEAQYGSAYTPASGDGAFLTWLYWEGSRAGQTGLQRGVNPVATAVRSSGGRRSR